MNRIRFALACSLLLFALPAADGRAQVEPTSLETDLATPTDTFPLPPVVVTATRVPLEREALPTPVTVLTGAELRARGVRTVGEALATVPSVAVVRAGGSGAQTSVFLRGGESDYVKVLIDGVAVNDPGGAVDFAGLSTDQVERIEVVRGPVSVLYGSDAVAGVIQIFTRRGSGRPTLTAETTAGSGARVHDADRYATYDVEAAVTGSSGPFSYAAGAGRRHSDGLYPLNNARALNTGTVRVSWAPGPAEVVFSSRVGDGRAHFPTDGAGRLVDDNAYLDRRLWSTSLAGGWRLSDRVDARLRLAVVSRDQVATDEADGPADTLGVYASTLGFDGTRRTADARVDVRLPASTLTAGVAWDDAEASTSYTSSSVFGPFDASAEYDRGSTGYYLQLLSRPVERLHVTAGGRLDESGTYGSSPTYRLGAALGVHPALRLRAAIGSGFREPTFAEAFGSGFGDLGNPDLDPERSRSWEVGAEAGRGTTTIAATWFDQRFTDLIQFTFAPPTAGGPNYFNVGAARSRGLELEGRVGSRALSAAASYSWVDTEVLDPGLSSNATFVEGEPLLRRPAHSGTLTGTYSTPVATASVVLNAVGEREDVDFGAGFPAPRTTLAPYATVDLAGDYRLPWGGADLRLLVRVQNLLGAEYQAIAGFPAGGRLVRLGARVRTR